MLAAVNDLAFSAEGYMWMGTNVVANVAHLIVLRKVPHTLPHALHTPVYAISLCSARCRIRRMRFIRYRIQCLCMRMLTYVCGYGC